MHGIKDLVSSYFLDEIFGLDPVIEQDHQENLVLTILDREKKGTIENYVSKMLLSLKEKGGNKVLWWNNR